MIFLFVSYILKIYSSLRAIIIINPNVANVTELGLQFPTQLARFYHYILRILSPESFSSFLIREFFCIERKIQEIR